MSVRHDGMRQFAQWCLGSEFSAFHDVDERAADDFDRPAGDLDDDSTSNDDHGAAADDYYYDAYAAADGARPTGNPSTAR